MHSMDGITRREQASRAALARYSDYLRFDPGNIGLMAQAVDAATGCGEIDVALSIVASMLSLRPEDTQILYSKAQVEIAGGRLMDAERTLCGLLERRGDAPEL